MDQIRSPYAGESESESLSAFSNRTTDISETEKAPRRASEMESDSSREYLRRLRMNLEMAMDMILWPLELNMTDTQEVVE